MRISDWSSDVCSSDLATRSSPEPDCYTSTASSGRPIHTPTPDLPFWQCCCCTHTCGGTAPAPAPQLSRRTRPATTNTPARTEKQRGGEGWCQHWSAWGGLSTTKKTKIKIYQYT